jgi:spore coat polysaccharide biosynthesis predicted glycosyltransferase SpsG
VNVTLAFDEGPGIGLGHRRRCQYLAGALRRLGADTDLRSLGECDTIAASVLVVDSYRARADDDRRFVADHIVAIDDLARDLAVDLLVDPDPGADGSAHRRAERVLAGAAFALVDPALARCSPGAVEEPVTCVLVTTGAADASGVGDQIATACATFMPQAHIRFVEGPWGAPCNDPDVEVVHAPDGLAEELRGADIVITAGGVTMLEACALGRPTIACVLAPNQSRSVAGTAHAGAVLAADPSSAPELAVRLARDARLRVRLSIAARKLVDGQGPTRIAEAVLAIASQSSQLH